MMNFYMYYNQKEKLANSEIMTALMEFRNIRFDDEKVKEKIKPILHIIKKTPRHAYMYARYVMNGRWPEAEPYIIPDAYYAYVYTDTVIKERWPEAEHVIMRSAGVAYTYAKNIIGGRWSEAEPYIMKVPRHAYFYARDVIKGRWLEAEPTILKGDSVFGKSTWKEYCTVFGI